MALQPKEAITARSAANQLSIRPAVAGVALMWPLGFAYLIGSEIVDMFRGKS